MVPKLYIGLAFVMLITGCASYPPLPPVAPETPLPEPAVATLPPTEEVYKLGPEDELQITVYEHEDLTKQVKIAPDGAFVYPLIGKVDAADKTVEELVQHMQTRLEADFLVDPQLSIEVSQYRNRHVYVLGAVQKPGVYPLKYNATLQEIISEAGGRTDEAGWEAVLVRAGGTDAAGANPSQDPKRSGVRIDLEKLLSGEMAQPIQVHNGDTIRILPGKFVYVSGEVNKPGRYRLRHDTTVYRAVILAGGFTKFAAKKQVRVKRKIEGQEQEFRAQLHDPLQPNDVIIVPESVL